MDLEKLALKWALKNAVDHDGRAMPGPVISKILGEKPELRSEIRRVKEAAEKAVERVNQMSLEEQRRLLEEVAPELLKARKVEEKRLPPLPGAEKGKVVTRLPPEPSGYMHIGHAMSGLLNYLYARMYDGRIWLRFEDTDPRKVKPEYYESFRRGYRWLGIEWDHEKNNSDDMELFYKYAEQLIKMGKAYVCTCPVEKVRRLRASGEPCEHRNLGRDENLSLWNDMLAGGFREGEATLRLVGDMRSKNMTMRDPALFRIIEHPHPLTGDRYRVWPLYDFAVSIEDHLCGVTHVLRTSEFAPRDELQNYIRGLLGMKNPIYIEYSRFEFKGTPVSKRKLRAIIEAGIASSWDDPRFPTIEGIRRRGILPEAIREFTISQTGFSYAKREYDWSLLFAINRRLLDPKARRLFFVPDPVKLVIEDAPRLTIDAPYHPSNPDLGSRRIEAFQEFYIAGSDAEKMEQGSIYRLKYLLNFEVIAKDPEGAIRGRFLGREPMKDIQIIQWVPAESFVELEVIVPDVLYHNDEVNPESLKIVKGYGERAVESVRVDEIVQFERFGFCRRDSAEELRFIKAHD